MRKYKENELVKGNMYQDREGLYIYKGNYEFDEVTFEEDDIFNENPKKIDTLIRKENELYFE